MKKVALILSLLAILLNGCEKTMQINRNYNNSLIYSIKEGGIYHTLTFNNDKEVLCSINLELKGDISYSYQDYIKNKLFLFGPGGLVEVDTLNNRVDYILEKDVSFVFKNGQNYGYVENVGFKNGAYSSKIFLEIGGQTQFDVPYPVNSIFVQDDKLIISSLPLTEGEPVCMDVYDLNGNLQSRKTTNTFGRVDILNTGKAIYVTTDSIIIDNKEHFLKKRYSAYDHVSYSNGVLYALSYDYNSNTCYISTKSNYETFDSCHGISEIKEDTYLLLTNDDLTIVDLKNETREKCDLNLPEGLIMNVFVY